MVIAWFSILKIYGSNNSCFKKIFLQVKIQFELSNKHRKNAKLLFCMVSRLNLFLQTEFSHFHFFSWICSMCFQPTFNWYCLTKASITNAYKGNPLFWLTISNSIQSPTRKTSSSGTLNLEAKMTCNAKLQIEIWKWNQWPYFKWHDLQIGFGVINTWPLLEYISNWDLDTKQGPF